MSSEAVRKGDRNTGHPGAPPTPLDEGAETVFAEGSPIGRKGDAFVPHGSPPHVGKMDEGSGSVFAEGAEVARKGGQVDCHKNNKADESASSVHVGD